jgi:transcriptional regulator with XRE-family HTH domain
MIDIAEELRKIREIAGFSQQKMADLIGIPQRTWSSYESGQTRPKMDVLFALAERGYPIKGLTTSPIDDWSEEKKQELQRRIDIVKTGAFDLDTPLSDIVKMIKAVDAHPPLHSQSIANLSITSKNDIKIPLLKQKVSCGQGVNWETEENIEEYIEVDMLIPRLGIGRVFAVKAEGSSMLGAGIHAGDYIFFDGSEEQTPQDGIYVFALDGDVYCKRLEFDKLSKKIKIFSVRFSDLEKAELVTSLDTRETEFADRFRIFGKVTRCIRLIDVEDK